MLGYGVVALLVLAQAPAPQSVEDELRRAKNEYAYGNYDEAVRGLRALLYPMRLSTDEQVIDTRKYLALSYYLLDRLDEVGDEFAKLLHLDPDYQLDPFTVAPLVIEMFETVRKKLQEQLDVIRQLRSDTKLEQPMKPGVTREIERTFTERSEFATFMPFGIGQFQNDHIGWGVVFAVSELILLTSNIVAYMIAVRAVGNDYQPDDRSLVQALIVTQYGSLALFGLVWSLGVFHARLHFVPVIESPKVVREIPITAGSPPPGPGLALELRW